jgi:hypothetical protein
VSLHTTNRHVVTLMQLSSDFYMLETTADHRIGDRAYDEVLKQDGVNISVPHRPTLKLKTQTGATSAIPTPLACRALLCMAAMETPPTRSLAILRLTLPLLCADR